MHIIGDTDDSTPCTHESINVSAQDPVSSTSHDIGELRPILVMKLSIKHSKFL